MIIFQWYFLIISLVGILGYLSKAVTADTASEVGQSLVGALLSIAQLVFFCYLYWK